MNNILITGASGFIGSTLVEEGIKQNYTVYAGIRKNSSRKYLTDPAIRFIEMDFSSQEKIAGLLREYREKGINFRYIVHNAGITKAGKKEDYYKVNCRNTQNFIEALKETGTIPEKFIYISSLAAYGPGDPETMKPVMLSDEPKPIELYGKSKLEAEKYIISQQDFPWIILRPTGVYGPKERDYYVFFQTINRGLETYIGSSKQILTFIYVKDLVKLVYLALPSPVVRHAYFVSDGKEYDTETFSSITKKILNKKTIKITVPSPVVKHLAYGLEKVFGLWGVIPTLNTDKYNVLSSRNWRCEVDPLKVDFGFTADYDLEKGVRETIEWYKKEKWLR
jgi:nucleoside-diphosphate-sugar epimerase